MITALNESEVEEVFERSSGPGGQNVNKVATKVLLRLLELGVEIRRERGAPELEIGGGHHGHRAALCQRGRAGGGDGDC